MSAKKASVRATSFPFVAGIRVGPDKLPGPAPWYHQAGTSPRATVRDASFNLNYRAQARGFADLKASSWARLRLAKKLL